MVQKFAPYFSSNAFQGGRKQSKMIFIKRTTFAPRTCVRTWNVTLRQACIEKMKFCILLMLADKKFTCVAPIVSVRVQALLAI